MQLRSPFDLSTYNDKGGSVVIEHCHRGEIYYADLGKGCGSEQEGFRPVLIVQNDVGNRYGSTTIVAPISAQIANKAKLPTHHHIELQDGLEKPSVIMLEQLRTISKKRLARRIGTLSQSHIHCIDQCLAVSVGLIPTPPRSIKLHLCNSCANHLSASGDFLLESTSGSTKKLCTYCNQGFGPAYEIHLLSSMPNEKSHK